MTASTRPRAVVCGATFGRVYLAALTSPGSPFEAAGVVGQGGERSRACADEYGLPYYTGAGKLPDDIAVACVVVRAGVVGGSGDEIARSLLDRGVHVLQEQPTHPDEIAARLREAHGAGVQYRVNPFYAHTEPVRRFLAAARALAGRRAVLFVDAMCAIHVAYPLVDILARALSGPRPWDFTPGPAPRGPYGTVDGVIGGVPLTLRVQNEIDPADPDNHTHLLFRMALGTDAGVLTLADAHGPLLWSPRTHAPRTADGGIDPHAATGLDRPAATALGPAGAPAYRDLLRTTWPAGVTRALTELDTAIRSEADPLTGGQLDLAVSQAWRDLTAPLGPPRLVHPAPPRPLDAGELLTAIREETD